ncbi:MAG: cytochrome c biogenesis protein CcsA [Cytophagales bacterium]
MFRSLIGQIGHLLVTISFITAILSSIGFFFAVREKVNENSWKTFARTSFYIHVIAVFGTVISLFAIIYNHYYEYHYAWNHSSNNLPTQYMISCFWEGQEGSFLLWIFWHSVLGLIFIRVNKYWEAPAMSIFMVVQAFLASMILGVVIPWVNLKIGTSPFILLREVMTDLPVFQLNPDFVPEDGTGLNPLLQNYWMVIHPPTTFLGFALTLVPFSYILSGLWLKKYQEWIRPALPWTLVAAMILGTGILMGGYWAYETLNFGGYWNWDPVENAVYIPWLVLVASIHIMITYRKSGRGLKTSMILLISTFILILYSNYLVKSGVLEDTSVHSFTDMGMSGQLLIYLLFFTFISVALLIKRWKEIPVSKIEVSTYSREFWVFIGATTLGLAAFQVFVTTSIPVFNAIIKLFNIDSNIAPPPDPIAHYSNIQIWFASAIALLSAIGQFFWWQKIDKKTLWQALSTPAIIAMLISSAILLLIDMHDASYIVLMSTAVFSIIANSKILISLRQSNIKLSGGSIAHIGIAMMLIGILFSSGYSKVISLNASGIPYSKNFSESMNRENILLWRDAPQQMDQYSVIYRGPRVESRKENIYLDKDFLSPTSDQNEVIIERDLKYKGEIIYQKGDTIEVYGENTYYEVEYQKDGKTEFTLFPRAQVNEAMGGLIASPDIRRNWEKDIYTHVSSIINPNEELDWSEIEIESVDMNSDTFFINDFIAYLERIERIYEYEGIKFKDTEAGVKAQVKVMGNNKEYFLEPVFIIRNDLVGRIPDESTALGIKMTIHNIIPENNEIQFGISTAQKDYIIMKAMEKPLINVLWIGTLIMVFGFCLAIYRRYTEFKKMRDKQLE